MSKWCTHPSAEARLFTLLVCPFLIFSLLTSFLCKGVELPVALWSGPYFVPFCHPHSVWAFIAYLRCKVWFWGKAARRFVLTIRWLLYTHTTPSRYCFIFHTRSMFTSLSKKWSAPTRTVHRRSAETGSSPSFAHSLTLQPFMLTDLVTVSIVQFTAGDHVIPLQMFPSFPPSSFSSFFYSTLKHQTTVSLKTSLFQFWVRPPTSH